MLATVAAFAFCVSDLEAQRTQPARGAGVVSKVAWSEDGKSVDFTTEGNGTSFLKTKNQKKSSK